jgi:hypothetical protein
MYVLAHISVARAGGCAEICINKNKTTRMKSSASNFQIQKRIRQVVVLAFMILIGIIVTLSKAEAKGDHRFGHKNVNEIRKQNKRYANACELLKAKRKVKPADKARTAKWR